jgi:ribokinase
MILVAGSANLDYVVRAAHIPAPAETVLGGEFRTFPGGKGANQAVACARAGSARTHMVLALGNDAPAQAVKESLQQANVEMHVAQIADAPSGVAFICVADDGENAITVAPGANARLAPEHLPALGGFSHLLMQLETPVSTVLAYARAARTHGVKVVVNAAPAQTLPVQLLGLIDILIVNEGELRVVSACQGSVSECLDRLTVPTVIVTLGHRGSCARERGHIHLQDAFAVTAVDTTAAGDTFCGALVAELGRSRALESALRFASAAAALACTRSGAQSSIPDAAEVSQFLEAAPTADENALVRLRQYCGLTPLSQ